MCPKKVKDSENADSGEIRSTKAKSLDHNVEEQPAPLDWRNVEVKGASEDHGSNAHNRIKVSEDLEWAEEAREKYIC